MSVMEQLKKYSQEGGEPYEAPQFDAMSEEQAEKAMQLGQSIPIPGQSLTQSPDAKLPYEQPPKFTEAQPFIDETFLRFTEEDKLELALDMMRMGVPLEFLAEQYLTKCFERGDISVDLMLLVIEPVIYILIALGTYADINMVLYPEDDMRDVEKETAFKTKAFSKISQELKAPQEDKVSIDTTTAPNIQPRSLLSRAKEAVEGVSNA